MNKFERALDQLKKGIKSYVERTIDTAPFDKTLIGVVNSVDNNNLYSVTINNQQYNNISCMFKGIISSGDVVKVKVPQNNYNLMYIEGKLNTEIEGGGSGGTTNYNDLSNQPQINGVTLSGNKTTSDLGISIPTNTSDLTNDSGFITSNDLPTIDSSLSTTSTNAVQNKVVTQELDSKQDNLNLTIVDGQICITYEE